MFISKKIDDKEVLSSYINGNESALNVLIDRHRSRIFGFIISKVKNVEVAEDIFQDAFIKVINTIKKGKYNEQPQQTHTQTKTHSCGLFILHSSITNHLARCRQTERTTFERNDPSDPKVTYSW